MDDPITKGAVERWARIIDPEAWSWRPLPRQPNEGPASKLAFDEQDAADTRDVEKRKDVALAKAEAILTTLNLGELVTALEVFAAYADPRCTVPQSFEITKGSSLAKRQLTMGDCYAAARALARFRGGVSG